MLTYVEAMNEVVAGKKVRMSGWSENEYVFLAVEGYAHTDIRQIVPCYRFFQGYHVPFIPSDLEIVSPVWEVCGE
jgi:NADH:ubiquinone oxidoreductase subunit H